MGDLPVMMDLETGDEDLLVMIVTCAVDPLEMKDLAPPLRDPQENKTKAGPLLRPSVNSQLSSRLSARARFITRVHVRPSELCVSWHQHHYRTGFLNTTLSVLLLSYSYIFGRTLNSDGRLLDACHVSK